MNEAVRDNTERHRYELETDGGTAVAVYRREGKVTTFAHTEVPRSVEGRGIGSALVIGALDLVREAGGKIVVECSFVAEFIAKHPEYQGLLARPQAVEKAKLDDKLEEALRESFPASDPPAIY